MNAKVKVPTGTGSKQKATGNLPITGQSLKIGGQNAHAMGQASHGG